MAEVATTKRTRMAPIMPSDGTMTRGSWQEVGDGFPGLLNILHCTLQHVALLADSLPQGF
jgi:hypothetical protein